MILTHHHASIFATCSSEFWMTSFVYASFAVYSACSTFSIVSTFSVYVSLFTGFSSSFSSILAWLALLLLFYFESFLVFCSWLDTFFSALLATRWLDGLETFFTSDLLTGTFLSFLTMSLSFTLSFFPDFFSTFSKFFGDSSTFSSFFSVSSAFYTTTDSSLILSTTSSFSFLTYSVFALSVFFSLFAFTFLWLVGGFFSACGDRTDWVVVGLLLFPEWGATPRFFVLVVVGS